MYMSYIYIYIPLYSDHGKSPPNMFVTILVAELPSTSSGFYSNQLRKEPLDAFDAAANQL